MSKVIGIDLGTKSSSVAIMEGRIPKVICSLPSVVAITESNDRIVGESARQFAVENLENTFSSFHRLLGIKYDSPYVIDRIRTSPYNIINGSNGYAWLKSKDAAFSPIEITAYVLMQLKKEAEKYLGTTVTDAVISVPNYFDMIQRQAVKDAGKIAGLNVLRLKSYSVCAALAYGLDRQMDEKIAVIDLGAGSLDVAILELGNCVFEVKSTNGDMYLGGDDFDQLVIDWVAAEFKRDQCIDLRGDKMALQRIKVAAEKAKCKLSTSMETDINLPFITADASGPKHLPLKLSSAKLETICAELLSKLDGPCRTALKDAGLSPSQIDKVILVGGMTRMPAVKKWIEKFFNNVICEDCDENNLVSKGAAIEGGVLVGEVKDILLLDVTTFSLGIETPGGVMTRLIEKNTTIPCRKSQIFTTSTVKQATFPVTVLQGEREMAKDNLTLGCFVLSDIPISPWDSPQIEVTFDVDANGTVHVSAKDIDTGKEQSIRISASSGFSKEEIDKMVRDVEIRAYEERKKREAIEARNQADSKVYTTERSLKEHGHKIDAVEKGKIKNKLAELKKLLKGEDTEAIKKATDELAEASYKLAEAMYSKQSVFNFDENIIKYDLAAIRGSHVQYYTETIRWFDNLLTYLDSFIRENADLLSEAHALTNRLIVAHHDNEYPVLTERSEYLAQHLNFGVEILGSKLIAFKNEAVAGRDRLANAQDLASLREIEKLERPDFYLVAELTAGMVIRQLAGVDWFREHKELAATLIDLHETWRDDFHAFEHTSHTHFMEKCRHKKIPKQLAETWFSEWQQERLLIEEHLLPLMKAAIDDKVIPVESAIKAATVLKVNLCDKLNDFYDDKRMELHIKFALQPGYELLERFEKDLEFARINAGFQEALENLIFKVDSIEGRLFLTRWAKDWYDALIGDVLAYIERGSQLELVAKTTLDGFRSMKQHNLEAFLVDAKSYAEAREQKYSEFNELMYRMKQDLVAKDISKVTRNKRHNPVV